MTPLRMILARAIYRIGARLARVGKPPEPPVSADGFDVVARLVIWRQFPPGDPPRTQLFAWFRPEVPKQGKARGQTDA